jgi:hypothetical protein
MRTSAEIDAALDGLEGQLAAINGRIDSEAQAARRELAERDQKIAALETTTRAQAIELADLKTSVVEASTKEVAT